MTYGAAISELAFSSAVTKIVDVKELNFQEDRNSSAFDKFASQVLLLFKVDKAFTSEQHTEIEALFFESYNSTDALNVDTCNPHFQQVHTANFTYM
jgi:predicted HAD superfamily Cof-like phosphohydrolase